MGKVINFVYGAILLWLSLESLGWLSWLTIFPQAFVPYAVLLMGVAVMATPIGKATHIGVDPRPPFNFIRRYLFGAALILIGLASSIGAVASLVPLLVIGTSSGSLILLAISVIYFLSALTRTRGIAIGSV